MSVFVVDSSVVVKWFVPEVSEAEALRVRDGGTPLHAPNFLDVEVGNILWKKVQRGELRR
jgi:predicted nucleic acid-binding protein